MIILMYSLIRWSNLIRSNQITRSREHQNNHHSEISFDFDFHARLCGTNHKVKTKSQRIDNLLIHRFPITVTWYYPHISWNCFKSPSMNPIWNCFSISQTLIAPDQRRYQLIKVLFFASMTIKKFSSRLVSLGLVLTHSHFGVIYVCFQFWGVPKDCWWLKWWEHSDLPSISSLLFQLLNFCYPIWCSNSGNFVIVCVLPERVISKLASTSIVAST